MDIMVDCGHGDSMALICVEPTNEDDVPKAHELAKTLGVPLASGLEPQTSKAGVKVLVSGVRVGLGFMDPKRGKPFYVDFLTRSWRTRFASGLGRNHIFTRALGFKGQPLKILDSTAGFGQDTMMAVCLGCDVVAVERSRVVAAVLRNGILRAAEDEAFRKHLERLTIVDRDATEFLNTDVVVDVIYIDPMFEKPKKSAKSPKEMQLLQELFEGTTPGPDIEVLFQKAMARAKQRVVVKRPLKSRALGRAPTHSYKGQSIRYDVYVTSGP
jgi:16S rRNA (guanine1516-N2)-methyltransferase